MLGEKDGKGIDLSVVGAERGLTKAAKIEGV